MATVEKNGEHSRAAPISSNTTASSDIPAPAPPNSSGTAMPCSPSSPAIWRQTAPSYPDSVAMSSRTVALGEAALEELAHGSPEFVGLTCRHARPPATSLTPRRSDPG